MRFVGRSFSKFFQSGTCPFASSLRDFLFIPAVFDAIAIACQRIRAESQNREHTPPSRRAPPSSHGLGPQNSQRGAAPLACSQTPYCVYRVLARGK